MQTKKWKTTVKTFINLNEHFHSDMAHCTHEMFGFIHNWLNKWVPVNEWTARMRTENAKSSFNSFLNDFAEQLKQRVCLWMNGIQVGHKFMARAITGHHWFRVL